MNDPKNFLLKFEQRVLAGVLFDKDRKQTGYYDFRLARFNPDFRPVPRWSISWYGTFIRRFITPG